MATVRSDDRGSVAVRFRVPAGARRPWYAVLTDAEGNYASFDGLSGKRA
jgi:hypothetical protein